MEAKPIYLVLGRGWGELEWVDVAFEDKLKANDYLKRVSTKYPERDYRIVIRRLVRKGESY